MRHHRWSSFVVASPLFAAAFFSSGIGYDYRGATRTFSDAASTTSGPAKPSPRNKAQNGKDENDHGTSTCPFFGCPLHPVDVHYNTEKLKNILQSLRDIPAEQVPEELFKGDPQAKGWNRRDAASLTLIGYKGGPLLQQINQDRAVVVSPFLVPVAAADDDDNSINNTPTSLAGRTSETKESDKENQTPNNNIKTNDKETTNLKNTSLNKPVAVDTSRILLGVFDGHAARGELVSEFTAQNLPGTLAQKLALLPPPPSAAASATTTGSANPPTDNEEEEMRALAAEEERQVATIRALHETFVELDQQAPADPSGGCTASVILLQDSKLYIANAGDSRSFIVAYRPSTKQVHIVYMSREDKPNLAEERARVEAMGGQVYIPMRGTSRVVYHDPVTGAPSGLAMSRSIGDWAAGALGVIPDPIVDVLEMPDIVQSILQNATSFSSSSSKGEQCYVMDENGEVDTGACMDHETHDTSVAAVAATAAVDDVYIFGVSATDGMMDYLSAEDIAKVLASSLFEEGGSHPVTACELLIFSAANGWQQDKQGRYRDDIAIAVSALRRPPFAEPKKQEA